MKLIQKKVLLQISLTMFAMFGLFMFIFTPWVHAAGISVWWPTTTARLSGMQPFKAMVPGSSISSYELFWQVDGGQWNWMSDTNTDSPHKEAIVDVSRWTWHGSGPYEVSFIERQNGTVVTTQTISVYIDQKAPVVSGTLTSAVGITLPAQPVVTSVATLATPIVVPILPTTPVAKPVSSGLYVNPASSAAIQAAVFGARNPSGASAMRMLAAQPTAQWFGNWNTNVATDVRALVDAAAAQGTVPVLVIYNIPQRDCGGFSAGGTNNSAGYRTWIQSVASGIGSLQAIVILEPDALAQIGCLSPADTQNRLQLLADAVVTLKHNPNTTVYIDAGHSNWTSPSVMAGLLQGANIALADGFSTNVSNFISRQSEIVYGLHVSSLVHGKHFVIDTSRNGSGSNGQWCNPSGMTVGVTPTTQTGNASIDAFLWLKVPGESDGACNGGPSAGVWWPHYALELAGAL